MSAATHEESADALRTLLRSFGQIVLQPNAITGACVLAAWLICDPRLACAALTGAVAANVGALLCGYDTRDMRDGLHGFNGALAGLAASAFIADDATAMAVAILATTTLAWMLGPWSRWLRTRGLGFYSSPCLLVTWAWLPFVHTVSVHAGAHAAASEPVALVRIVSGLLSGIAQTSFATSAAAGLLVLIGIAASSKRHALWALAGAAIASGTHGWIGADAASFDAGLLGFNGALTALALADCGALAAVGGVLVSVSLLHAAGYYGVPALSAPFVVATWTVQWCLRRRTRSAPMPRVVDAHTIDSTRTALPER
jgi:urea transporter